MKILLRAIILIFWIDVVAGFASNNFNPLMSLVSSKESNLLQEGFNFSSRQFIKLPDKESNAYFLTSIFSSMNNFKNFIPDYYYFENSSTHFDAYNFENNYERSSSTFTINHSYNHPFSKEFDFTSTDTMIFPKRIYIFKFKELQPIQPITFKPERKKVNFYKLGLITLGTTASVLYLHHHQSKAWWQSTRTSHFHFQNDWEYALWIDKLGHWWGASAIHHIFSSSLSWANFSDETSVITGSILSLAYQVYVETYDGYASNWGFSPGDALFDLGGSMYPLLQYYFPSLKNINLKLSYYPSKRLIKKNPNDSLYKNKFVIDDYEGQSFYLSFKVNNMLPSSLEKFWPDFLCLALGYQMRNWNGYGVADQNFFVALDYDLEQIPLYGDFWQLIKKTFNLFHLPSPGIRISNKKVTFTIAY